MRFSLNETLPGNFRLLVIAFLFCFSFLCFSFRAQAAANPARSSISEDAKALLAQRWNASSIENGLVLIGNRNETVESRIAVLDKFRSEAKNFDSATLFQLFKQTVLLAKDPTEAPEVSTSAIRTMVNVGVLLGEKGQLTKEEIRREVPFLIEIANNRDRDINLRGAAIRATGVLGVEEASTVLRQLLDDPIESNKPEIAQNALLSIYRLLGKDAINPIADILSHTQNPAIFGTAAFSLGQIKTKKSMAILVQNEVRFPNSGVPDAVLVDMEDVILVVLENPQDANLSEAIRATRHLWRKGQRERYIPKLQGLLTTAPLSARKKALDRLFEAAGSLKFDDEKNELQKILPLIAEQTGFKEDVDRIQRRLTAVILTPNIFIPTPKKIRTNTR